MERDEPRRGEVWIVDTGYAGKKRPCVVLNVPTDDSDRALTTYVPCTTSGRGSRFEAPLDAPFLDKPGVVNAQGIATVDHRKLLRKLGSLTPDQLADIERAVEQWLGLS